MLSLPLQNIQSEMGVQWSTIWPAHSNTSMVSTLYTETSNQKISWYVPFIFLIFSLPLLLLMQMLVYKCQGAEQRTAGILI